MSAVERPQNPIFATIGNLSQRDPPPVRRLEKSPCPTELAEVGLRLLRELAESGPELATKLRALGLSMARPPRISVPTITTPSPA